MFGKLKLWHEQKIIESEPVNTALWQRALARAPVLECLAGADAESLEKLTILFLHEKTFTAAAGLPLDRTMELHIAAQACLLILHLGLDYFDGWEEIIIYPEAFVTRRDRVDENGLVHSDEQGLGGEAWGRGPLILSWDDARPGAHIHGQGSNVVLHEFAHKLDMLNGANANGMPPLHSNMIRQQWTDILSAAYEKLQNEVKHHHKPWIDPYGATNPAEFFAVITEHFFEQPVWLREEDKKLYQQLALFYRQDPATHISGNVGS